MPENRSDSLLFVPDSSNPINDANTYQATGNTAYMSRTLWEVFISLLRRNNERDEDGEKDGENFVPSPLDLSVRASHGGSDTEIERELNDIDEQAQKLQDNRRDT